MNILYLPFLFLVSALAQNVRIDAPAAGQTLQPGKHFIAKLTLLPYISSLRQVSVVIGLRHCLSSNPCNPDSTLGVILFAGAYKPTSPPSGGLSYQNFSLRVPHGEPAGEAMLSVAHFYLVGAENIPTLETSGISVNIG